MSVPRLPRLLDANMNETARLHPTRMSVEPNGDTVSTASMTLPPGETRVPIRAWVEIYTAQGSAGVYRVTTRKEDFGTETRLTLRHGLCSLEDCVLPGEGTLSGPARDVLAAILGAQKLTLWALGSVAETPAIEVDYNRTNALEALQDALAKLPDYALTFDQTSLPWRLGLVKLPAEDGAEARLSRNLKSVTVDEDDSELCTRVYIDDREGYTDGPTVGEYGVIERVLTLPDGATDEEARGYIDAYLREHQRPTRTVTLDAYDISPETGESLDAFRLWKNARVPLPAFGETLRERITQMTYPDVFDDPSNVRVTVGSRQNSLSDLLASLSNRATNSERDAASTSKRVSSNAQQIEKNITELHDTYTELVKLGDETATRFNEVQITLDAQKAEIDLKASSADVTALGSRVSEAEINISGLDAKITLQASRVDTLEGWRNEAQIAIDGAHADILLWAQRTEDNETKISQAQIDIDGANAAITANASRIDEVAGTVSEAQLAIDGANARIDAEAKRIDDANGLISAANLAIDGANARIEANASRLDTQAGQITEAGLAIDGVKGEVALKASQSSVDALGNRVTEAEASITVHTNEIALRVKAGDIASSINQTAQSVKISASKIELDGYVTASQLSAVEATIENLSADYITVSDRLDKFNTVITENGIAADVVLARNNLTVGSASASWQSVDVVTDVKASVKESTGHLYAFSTSTATNKSYFEYVAGVSVSITKDTTTLHYLGR